MERLFLNKITTATYDEWSYNANSTKIYRLLVSVSGYEERSICWTSKTIKIINLSEMTNYLVIGFEQLKDKLSRLQNNVFYMQNNLTINQLSSDEWDLFEKALHCELEKVIEKAGEMPIEIHIDYSSMPRRWYCRLPNYLEKIMRRKDIVYFWYTPGHYVTTEYPTAGVEDFHIFSGKSTLSPKFRTHLFGLGFDKIRSQAIWSVLDPENLVCFYTEPGTEAGYVEKVKLDNKDILLATKNVFSVPMHDFVYAFSKLVGMVREYRNIGDVVLVPDGPKPLILASSIVPPFLSLPGDGAGIVCFHVTRRKSHQYEPVDVKPAGMPYGFCFSGMRNP